MLFVFIFSGCSFELKSVDSLIRAPKLTGENADIQKVFEKAVGSDIVLVSPSAGKYRSSYVLVDYDNDSVDETIVFYYKKSGELTVRLHFLDSQDGVWYSVCDVSTGGSDIYEMRLASIDGDKIPEILITWSVTDTNRSKYMTVFKGDLSNGNDIAPIATLQIDEYKVLDINVDGVNEIFYTFFDSSTDEYLPYAAVQRYDVKTKSFLQIGEAAINSLAVSFASYSFDMKEGVNRIYIDCLRADGLYFTELLCWDTEDSILRAVLNEKGNSAALTSRLSSVYCRDIAINGVSDGLIEIPSEESPKGSMSVGGTSGISGSVIVRTWSAYSDNKLVPVLKLYVNSSNGYQLELPDALGNVDILQYENTGIAEIYSSENGKRGDLLFTITSDSESVTTSASPVNSFDSDMSIKTTDAAVQKNITEDYIRRLIIPI